MNNFLRRKLRKGISFVAACAIMATNVSPWLVASYASEVPEEAYYEGADEDYEEASEEYFETPEVTMTPEAESADAYFEGSAEPTEAPSEAPDVADEAEYGLEETPDQEEAEVPDYEIDEMEDPDGDGIAEGVEAPDEMFEEDAFEEDAFENDASEDDAETPDGQILENAPSVIFEESTEEVRVTVVAGLGVFPEGTTMEVKPAEDEETISKVSESVEDERTKVTDVKAVDVTFYNAEHEEIEPNGPVFVTLEDLTKLKENVAEEPAQKPEEAKAVHVTDEGECSMMAAASEEDLQYLPMEWEEDQAEDSIKKIEQLNEEATVAFIAESFSTYALVYTVDFEYSDPVTGETIAWKWPGRGSYAIEDIMREIGVEGEISDVSLVRTVDVGGSAKALYMSEDKTWLISEEAFGDAFELTVVIDEKTYVLIITDNATTEKDIASFLKGLTLTEGADGSPVEQTSDGTYIIKDSKNYHLKLRFEESKENQFDISAVEDGEIKHYIPDLVYNIPANVELTSHGTFTMKVGSKFIEGNTYSVNNGKLTVHFNENDEDYETLLDSPKLWMELDFDVRFNGDTVHAEFGAEGTGVINIVKDTSHDASVDKKIKSYDETTGKIVYQVDVIASGEGPSKNINVQDLVSGSLLSNISNLTIKEYDTTTGAYTRDLVLDNGYTSNSVAKGFDITITELAAGKKATIEYEVTVDQAAVKKSGNATFDETGNKVKINVPGDDNPDNNEDTEYKKDINVSSISKTSSSTSDVVTKTIGGQEREIRTVSYEIVANPEQKVSLAGTNIVDTNISTNLAKYNEKVTVKVYNGTALVRTDEVTIPANASSWTYPIPAGDQAYKYVLTYSTDVDVTGWTQAQQVKNSATFRYGGDGTTVNVPPKPIVEKPVPTVNKYATLVRPDNVTWKITIDVPAGGSEDFSITDNIPNIWGNSIVHDMITTADISYEGLTADELANLTVTINNAGTVIAGQNGMETTPNFPEGTTIDLGQNSVQFTFNHKDGDTVVPGFKGTGSNRTVTITLKTTNNPYWLDLTAKHSDNGSYLDHTNNVGITGEGTIGNNSPKVQPFEKTVKKKKTGVSEIQYTSNGEKMEAYKFEVTLTGVTVGDFDITETFDTRFFKILNVAEITNSGSFEENLVLFGGNQYHQGYKIQGKHATVTETNTGALLHISEDIIPKDGDAYYSNYKLVYYLVPKSEKAFDLLREYTAQNGTIKSSANGDTSKISHFNNRAVWEGIPGESSFEYELEDVIEKRAENAVDGGKKGLVKYTIVYNKNKVRLNNGDLTAIYDQLEHAVPYKFNTTEGFIQVTVEDKAGNTVSYPYSVYDGQGAEPGDGTIVLHYDRASDRFTYIDHVPDECKVTIVYWAQPDYNVVNGSENEGNAYYGKALSNTDNTVSVGDFNYSINNTQNFNVLSKEQSKNKENNTVTYTIKYNEGALTLNNQVDFPVTDTVKGIRIDPTSFNVTATPNTVEHKANASATAETISDVAAYVLASKQVSNVDAEKGEATYSFTIPDGVYVQITYTGTPVYTLNTENGRLEASYSNEVEGDNIVKKVTDEDDDQIVTKEFGDYIAMIEANADNPHRGTMPFTIVFNPTRARLNNGKDMELVDSYENLSIVYSTIEITTVPAENKVTYDFSGNNGYFVVPDETKVVLTYYATPIFDMDNKSTWRNNVSVHGFSDETSGETIDESHAEGGGEVENHIYLFKYEKGNMANGLADVTFSLYTMNEENQLVTVNDLQGNPIKFTTQENEREKGKGYVKIALAGKAGPGVQLETGKVYYLHEDAAPTDYYQDDVYYNFMIVDESSDYTAEDGIYVYKKGDILKVPNKPVTDDITAYKLWITSDGKNEWPETLNDNVQLKLVLYNTISNTEKAVAKPQSYYDAEATIPAELKDLAYLTNGIEYTEWGDATMTLSKGMWSVTWKGLDKISDELKTAGWVYRVKEVGENAGKITLGGVDYEVYGGEVNNGEACITNSERTDVKFEKKWQNITDTITVAKPTGADVTAPAVANGDGTVSVPMANVRMDIQLHRYYRENGILKKDHDFDLSDGDEQKYGEIKTLYGSEVSGWNSDVYTGFYTEGNPGTWTAHWYDLPTAGVDASGNTMVYIYQVEEKSVKVDSAVLSVSGQDADITNEFRSTSSKEGYKQTITNRLKSDTSYSLSVTKKWKDADGKTITDAPDIQFQLLRDSVTSPLSMPDIATIKVGNGYSSGEWYSSSINNEYHVGDIVKVSFTTTSWFNGFSLEGATERERERVFIQSNDPKVQSITFKITEKDVKIYAQGGGIGNNTTYTYELIDGVVKTNSTAMRPVDTNDLSQGIVNSVEEGEYLYPLSPNQTISFKNLPYTGPSTSDSTTIYTYRVVEVPDSGDNWEMISVTPSSAYNPAPRKEGDDPRSGSFTITNRKNERYDYGTAELVLDKELKREPNNTKLEGITFTLTDATGKSVASGATDAAGHLALTIPKTALGKHNGAGDTTTTKTFTLTETPNENYKEIGPWTVTVTANGTTETTAESIKTITYNWHVTSVGGLTGNSGVYTIVNEEKPREGSLILEKIIAPGSNASGKTFTFKVELTGTVDTSKLKLDGAAIDSANIDTSVSGKTTIMVQITGNSSKTITGIPDGTSYEVTEPTNLLPEGWKQKGNVAISGGDKNQVIAADETERAAITNEEFREIEVQKTWSNQPDSWPEGMTAEVELYAPEIDISPENMDNSFDGYSNTQTLSNSNRTYKWTGLQKYDSEGRPIEYTVKETDVKYNDVSVGTFAEQYDVKVGSSNGTDKTLQITDTSVIIDNTPKTTTISAKKIWKKVDGSDDANWPENLRVKVKLTGTTTTTPDQTITKEAYITGIAAASLGENVDGEHTAGTYTWYGLRLYDKAGKPYTWKVEEKAIEYTSDGGGTWNPVTEDVYRPSYSSDGGVAVNGGTVTITNTPEALELDVTKNWNNFTIPEGYKVRVTYDVHQGVVNGTEVIGNKIVTTKAVVYTRGEAGVPEANTAVWTGLARYSNDGKTEYRYWATEERVELIPDSAQNDILSNDSSVINITSMPFVVSGSESSAVTVGTGNDAGKLFQTLTNTVTKTKVTAKKEWKNSDGSEWTENLPSSVNFTLYKLKEGETTATAEAVTVTGTLDGTVDTAQAGQPALKTGELTAWNYTWDDLDAKYWDAEAKQYKAYTYAVKEASVVYGEKTYTIGSQNKFIVTEGALTGDAATGFTVTITNKLNEKDVEFGKQWKNASGIPQPWVKDGSQNAAITITLSRVRTTSNSNTNEYTDDSFTKTFTIKMGDEIMTSNDDNEENRVTYNLSWTTPTTPTGDPSQQDYIYKFKILGLEKYFTENEWETEWHYRISEEQPAPIDGKLFNAPSYSKNQTFAGENEYVINSENASSELPATGGPGTNLLYLLGSMLVMLAGAGFILLQRKKRVE